MKTNQEFPQPDVLLSMILRCGVRRNMCLMSYWVKPIMKNWPLPHLVGTKICEEYTRRDEKRRKNDW
jgi:hypothetical protein